MPAFDPVRDAVRSSPTEVGPGLARRATDLSVLLNDDNSAPAPTPAHADYDSATSPLFTPGPSTAGAQSATHSFPFPSPADREAPFAYQHQQIQYYPLERERERDRERATPGGSGSESSSSPRPASSRMSSILNPVDEPPLSSSRPGTSGSSTSRPSSSPASRSPVIGNLLRPTPQAPSMQTPASVPVSGAGPRPRFSAPSTASTAPSLAFPGSLGPSLSFPAPIPIDSRPRGGVVTSPSEQGPSPLAGVAPSVSFTPVVIQQRTFQTKPRQARQLPAKVREAQLARAQQQQQQQQTDHQPPSQPPQMQAHLPVAPQTQDQPSQQQQQQQQPPQISLPGPSRPSPLPISAPTFPSPASVPLALPRPPTPPPSSRAPPPPSSSHPPGGHLSLPTATPEQPPSGTSTVPGPSTASPSSHSLSAASAAPPSSTPSTTVTSAPIPTLAGHTARSPMMAESPRPPQQRQQRQGTLASSPSTFSLPPKPVQASPPPRSHEQGQARSRGTPYAPTRRFTQPASSLLMPLTPAEADLYAEWMTRGGLGARLLKSKKSQGHQQSGAQSSQHPHNDQRRNGERSGREEVGEKRERPWGAEGERPVKKSKDVGLVVEHYNARPDVGPDARRQSPIIGLKSFNNWVKSVLIQRFAHPALAASPSAGRHTGGSGHAEAMSRNGRSAKGGKVLDMGCGKGGDLIKWAKSPVREYVGLDIAAVSVEQARGRYQTLKGSPFLATFAALDCYTHPLSAALTPAQLSVPFDVVSMQFCMHYAFETVQKVRRMLENVSKWLRPGGIFLGTVPNADILLSRLDELPPDAEDLSFGNSVYKITFEDRVKRPIFGHRYSFFLKDAVEDVPEYIVHWDNFTQMAAEYGLHQVYKEEFHHVFTEHQTDPEFGQLLVRMKVADKDGNSQMDEDQWEAANIYLAFAFEKR